MDEDQKLERYLEKKAQFSKILASENIRFEHRAGERTASFNLKERLLILPMWKEMSDDLYNMLIAHEVGHALYTDWNEWREALLAKTEQDEYDDDEIGFDDDEVDFDPRWKSALNIVEDVRIEKLIKRRFPGIKANFFAAYTELEEKFNFFGLKRENYNLLSFADRVNIHFKMGVRADITFNPAEQAVVDAIEANEVFSNVSDLADDMLVLDRESVDIANRFFGAFDLFDGEIELTEEEMKRLQKALDRNVMVKETFGGVKKIDESLKEAMTQEDEQFYTVVASEAAVDELVDEKAQPIDYINIPRVDLKNFVVEWEDVYKQKFFDDRIRKQWIAFMKENSTYLVNMLKEFILRQSAKENKRARVAKTGRIDVDKLAKYQIVEDLFLQNVVTPTAKNHGMMMLVDMSGSMQNKMEQTFEQTLLMTLFCRRLKIPFEVYGFTDNVWAKSETPQVFQNGEMIFEERIRLKQLLTSKMTLAEYNRCAALLLHNARSFASGSTPLKESVIILTEVANEFRKRHRVEKFTTIIMTDGDGGEGFQYKDRSDGRVKYRENGRAQFSHPLTKETTSGKLHETTLSIIEMYGKVVKSTVIGYFVTSSRMVRAEARSRTRYMTSMTEADFDRQFKEEFHRHRFFGVVPTMGYDVFYIIPSTSIDAASENLDSILSGNFSKRDVLGAFKKLQRKKATSRAFLNRFIATIS